MIELFTKVDAMPIRQRKAYLYRNTHLGDEGGRKVRSQFYVVLLVLSKSRTLRIVGRSEGASLVQRIAIRSTWSI